MRYHNICACYLVLFHVLQHLPIRFTEQNLCSVSFCNEIFKKTRVKIESPLINYDYRMRMFFCFLNRYISSPNFVHYCVE